MDLTNFKIILMLRKIKALCKITIRKVKAFNKIIFRKIKTLNKILFKRVTLFQMVYRKILMFRIMPIMLKKTI